LAWRDFEKLDLQAWRSRRYGRPRNHPLEETIMRIPLLQSARVLVAAAAMALTLTAASAPTAEADHISKGCAAQFERAQRTDMESFRDYDAETFRSVHHPDAVTIFASGAVRYGIDQIMTALASHFTNREAIWAWTELYRIVDGCNSAFILYDATYDIPSVGYHQRTLVGVTYTHKGNRWVSIADQSTYLEAPGP
jgi:hypothetical protein